MTTADKLNRLLTTKQEIKNAIENKGVNIGDAPFAEYADKIEEIETGEISIDNGVILTQEGGVKLAKIYSDGGEIGDVLEGAINIEAVEFIGAPTKLSNSMLEGMTGLKVLNIPEGVITMGSRALHSCSSLIELTFPSTLTNLGYSALHSCTSLTSIEAPENVKLIEFFCMQNCSELSNVNLKGASEIRGSAFRNCTSLQNVTLGSIGNPVEIINSNAFFSVNSIFNLNIYVSNPDNPGIVGAPWGAVNATITYLQA